MMYNMGELAVLGGLPMKKDEEITKLKELPRKAHDARQRRQYDIVRLYLAGRKKPEITEIMDMSLQGMILSRLVDTISVM